MNDARHRLSGAALLREAVRGRRRAVTGGTLLLMTHQVAEALVPVVVGVVIDRAVATGETTALLWSLALLALLFVVLSNAFRIGYAIISRAGFAAEHELRVRLAQRVLDPAGGATAGSMPGELLSIATSDAKRAGAIAHVVAFGAAGIAAIAVAAVVLLRISVPLGLLVVLGLPPLLVVVNRMARPLVRRAGEQQERAAQVSGLATDLVSGLRVLRGVGAQDAAVERYRRSSRDALEATLRAARMEAAFDGAMKVFTGAFLVLVALVAGRLAAAGRISIGELIAAVGLTSFLVGPLEMLTWVGAELARARASAARIAAVLSRPAAVVDGTRAPASSRGALRLRNVSHEALRDLTLDVRSGEFVTILAGDPDDARALLACLARDVDPQDGTIELDGTPYDALELVQLRRTVLVAPHDAELFGATLAEAVAAPAGSATALDAALAATTADELVATLPDGLDSSMTEGGRSLSGGQRQRIALARAVLAQPAVLVLHDPTTAVDAATEARIASGLRRVREGRTTIVLTSSPALLAIGDRVIVIEGGAVAAAGSHNELLHRIDGYRDAVLA
ncbi:MAG: putative transport system ATP-binding protein [Solirubrobacteraceae bacterium]|nr:putative transport system ATP-binding protein [Solirubrobacteraceae bacterium]